VLQWFHFPPSICCGLHAKVPSLGKIDTCRLSACVGLLLQEDEQYQEGKLRFAGGRGEQATYEAGDEEDAAVRRQIDRQAAARQADGGSDDEAEGALQLNCSRPCDTAGVVSAMRFEGHAVC
jgi:hypothetical protein